MKRKPKSAHEHAFMELLKQLATAAIAMRRKAQDIDLLLAAADAQRKTSVGV